MKEVVEVVEVVAEVVLVVVVMVVAEIVLVVVVEGVLMVGIEVVLVVVVEGVLMVGVEVVLVVVAEVVLAVVVDGVLMVGIEVVLVLVVEGVLMVGIEVVLVVILEVVEEEVVDSVETDEDAVVSVGLVVCHNEVDVDKLPAKPEDVLVPDVVTVDQLVVVHNVVRVVVYWGDAVVEAVLEDEEIVPLTLNGSTIPRALSRKAFICGPGLRPKTIPATQWDAGTICLQKNHRDPVFSTSKVSSSTNPDV